MPASRGDTATTKEMLSHLSRLSVDVYGSGIGIDNLLRFHLDPQQLATLEAAGMGELVWLTMTRIRICFKVPKDGARLYTVLGNHYGLMGARPQKLTDVSKLLGISEERVGELREEALQYLRGDSPHSLDSIVCRAALTVLEQEQKQDTQPSPPPPPPDEEVPDPPAPPDPPQQSPTPKIPSVDKLQQPPVPQPPKPANHCASWTEDLDMRLTKLFFRFIEDAAAEMGRSPGSIHQHMQQMGLIERSSPERAQNAGKKWNKGDHEVLARLYQNNKDIRAISRAMGRTSVSIYYWLYHLGLIEPDR